VDSEFNTIFQRLNPAQRLAVETIEGPVMVMAGPGTGKTQVLAARIAHILDQTDTQPHQILALTFTESAATTMRRRLVRMIGRTGYYVQIMTFHAFCSGVIQQHPEFFDIDRESSPLTDIERFRILESLLLREDIHLNVLKPLNRPLFYIKDVIKAISDLKREYVSPERLQVLIEAEEHEYETTQEELTKAQREKKLKLIAKHTELHQLYVEYQLALHQKKRYDFDDMVSLVAQAFAKDDVLLLEYQEQLQYVLVDEYQDTNAAQNNIVDLLVSYW
jgi:DNA helicase II / ATP-dependent DNA helicase PcrA